MSYARMDRDLGRRRPPVKMGRDNRTARRTRSQAVAWAAMLTFMIAVMWVMFATLG